MTYKIISTEDKTFAVYNFRSAAHFLDWFRASGKIAPGNWIFALSDFIYEGQITDDHGCTWMPYEDVEIDMRTHNAAPSGYEAGNLPVPTHEDSWDDVKEREEAFTRSSLPESMSLSNLIVSASAFASGISVQKSPSSDHSLLAWATVNGEEVLVATLPFDTDDGWNPTREFTQLWKSKFPKTKPAKKK